MIHIFLTHEEFVSPATSENSVSLLCSFFPKEIDIFFVCNKSVKSEIFFCLSSFHVSLFSALRFHSLNTLASALMITENLEKQYLFILVMLTLSFV